MFWPGKSACDCMPAFAVVQVATGPQALKPPLECWQEMAVHGKRVWAELDPV